MVFSITKSTKSLHVLVRRISMYSFKNDYSEGEHPKILETLQNSNMIQF